MPLFPLRIFRIAERSMEPAIRQGSYALVSVWSSGFRPGDIVVLRHPSKNMLVVKRIKSVDCGRLYVLGDNSGESEDSRKFGPVSMKNVIGKVVFVV